MADIIPFRSRFDIDAESATAAALFGTEERSSNGDMPANDGGKARIKRRIAKRKAQSIQSDTRK